MKALLLSLLSAISLYATSQTIRIADNNPNAPTGANIFTGASALQNAITAAQPDDIVYIQPSTTSYGNATIGKRITLKGAGFNIAELGPRSSTVGNITLINSSDGVNNISNAVLTGFEFTNITFAAGTGGTPLNNILIENVIGTFLQHSASVPNVDNLIVRNCYLTRILIGQASATSNIKIYNNVIDGDNQLDIRNSSNLLITNNLFIKPSSPSISAQNSTNVRIEHNIFSGGGASFDYLVNALVVNNIFFGVTPGSGSPSLAFADNTFSNNLVLASVTMPPAGTLGGINSGVNNITGTGPQFTSAAVNTTWAAAENNNYTLLPGSACINAATTGDNIGPSGGLYPFTTNITFRATAMPLITEFGNSGVVPQNEPLKSNIKARSN